MTNAEAAKAGSAKYPASQMSEGWLGGLVIGHGYALDMLPWVAAAVAVVALLLTWFAARLDAPSIVPQRI